MHTDNGVDTLLDLNGNIVQQDHGFWVEIHAWRVESTALIPSYRENQGISRPYAWLGVIILTVVVAFWASFLRS